MAANARWTRRIIGVSALALSGVALACAGTTIREVEGDCYDLYGAESCTWTKMDGSYVVEMGMLVPMQGIEAAPSEGEMVWPPQHLSSPAMPEPVAEQTGFHHATVYWEHHGHPPGPYMTPHFDFHFYTQNPMETAAIDCSDVSKPESVPAGYTLPDVSIPQLGDLPGLCVPAMGMHALLAEELDSEGPFTATMVVGYYQGEVIFVEPMITREKLLERQSFALDVPSLPAREGVRYPTRFNAEYDAETDAYRFVFSGFGAAD